MGNSSPDIFRKILKRFVAADAELSKKLRAAEKIASARQAEVAQKSQAAEEAVEDYFQQLNSDGAFKKQPDPSPEITPEIDTGIRDLRKMVSDVKRGRVEVTNLNSRIQALSWELAEVLEKEKQEQRERESKRLWELARQIRRRRIRIAVTIFASLILVLALIFLHFWFLKQSTLSFSFSVDDGRSEIAPDVDLDNKPFSSGSNIVPGHHHLSVDLKNAEHFDYAFWTFYGKKDLGKLSLHASRGSLAITVEPSPAKIRVMADGFDRSGDAPLKLEGVPVGVYSLVTRRGDYSQTNFVKVERQRLTETNIILNLGGVHLSAVPPDATFELSGSGRSLNGQLPVHIDEIPAGTYKFIARRRKLQIVSEVVVSTHSVTTNQVTFQYGSISVASKPTGLAFSIEGGTTGKTPAVISEVEPGSYRVSITDGENTLITNLVVTANNVSQSVFEFRYGSAQLSSLPSGTSVIRDGVEIGKTPLPLEHLAIGAEIAVQLRRDGYVSTNFIFTATGGPAAFYTVKLFQLRYVNALNAARQNLEFDRLQQASNSLAIAIELEPNDPVATTLSKEIAKRAEVLKHRQLEAERLAAEEKYRKQVAEFAALPELDPQAIVINCWNSQKEPLPGISHQEVGAGAIPIYGATEVVVTGAKVVLSPLKLFAKKQFRFVESQFADHWKGHSFRYRGTVADFDEKKATIIFATKAVKGGGVHVEKGTFIIPDGNIAKLTCGVFARLQSGVLPAKFPLQVGTNIWISGEVISLDDTAIGLAANRLTLTNCMVYPDNILDNNK